MNNQIEYIHKKFLSRKIDNRGKFLTTVSTLVNKAWSSLLDLILEIGHLQILKDKIAYELNTACKFEAKHMEAALRTLNE